MISERSFTLQGRIINVSSVGKTEKGEDLQKFILETLDISGNLSRFEVVCKGKSLPYITPKLKKGAVVKVTGNIWSSYKKATDRMGQERVFFNYSLYADRVVADTDEAPRQEEPQRYLEETVQGTPSITDDELPF
jgi:hypothetical protein